MDLFFLQIDSSAVTQTTAPKTQNLWEILVSGGVIMIPLAILFVGGCIFLFRKIDCHKQSVKN